MNVPPPNIYIIRIPLQVYKLKVTQIFLFSNVVTIRLVGAQIPHHPSWKTRRGFMYYWVQTALLSPMSISYCSAKSYHDIVQIFSSVYTCGFTVLKYITNKHRFLLNTIVFRMHGFCHFDLCVFVY